MELHEAFEAWLITDYKNDLYGAFEAGWNRRASPASVPEGWKLVPMKADVDMQNAGGAHLTGITSYAYPTALKVYAAMLAAAPTPPVSEDRKDADRYRWLRSQQIDLNTPHLGVLNSGIFIGKIPDNVVLSDEDADAAIDKAMEGK